MRRNPVRAAKKIICGGDRTNLFDPVQRHIFPVVVPELCVFPEEMNAKQFTQFMGKVQEFLWLPVCLSIPFY